VRLGHVETACAAYGRRQVRQSGGEVDPQRAQPGASLDLGQHSRVGGRALELQAIERTPLGVPAPVIEGQLAPRDPVQPADGLLLTGPAKAPGRRGGLGEHLGPEIQCDLGIRRAPRQEQQQRLGVTLVEPRDVWWLLGLGHRTHSCTGAEAVTRSPVTGPVPLIGR
jgi:hypothetical protein